RAHGLGHHRRVVAEGRRDHTRAQLDAVRSGAQRTEPGEGKWGVSARVAPGLEVVADDDAVEANLLRVDTEIEKLDGSKLLGGRLVSKPQRRHIAFDSRLSRVPWSSRILCSYGAAR